MRRLASSPPPLPATLKTKLLAYRRRLWATKGSEAVLAAFALLLLSFLAVFFADRLVDTATSVRSVLLVCGLVGGVVFLPIQLLRWVGGHRTLKDVASRVIRYDLDSGDRLLGVLDLCADEAEYRRSPELVEAAIAQAERDLGGRSLEHTLPRSRHSVWGAFAAVGILVTFLLSAVAPAAARNAFERWLLPLGDTERFTFVRLDAHENDLVVPRSEPFEYRLALAPDTERRPRTARLRLADGEWVTASLKDGRYVFDVPPQVADVGAFLVVGDWREVLGIKPLDRPEIRAARASVELPEYLGLSDALTRDLRSGSLGVVEGSTVSVLAELTRELSEANWTGGRASTRGNRLETEALPVVESVDSELRWRDVHGLEGTVPFHLRLRAHPDAKPTVLIEGLQAQTRAARGQGGVLHGSGDRRFRRPPRRFGVGRDERPRARAERGAGREAPRRG